MRPLLITYRVDPRHTGSHPLPFPSRCSGQEGGVSRSPGKRTRDRTHSHGPIGIRQPRGPIHLPVQSAGPPSGFDFESSRGSCVACSSARRRLGP